MKEIKERLERLENKLEDYMDLLEILNDNEELLKAETTGNILYEIKNKVHTITGACDVKLKEWWRMSERMSNERAREESKMLYAFLYDGLSEKQKQALDIAIESLEEKNMYNELENKIVRGESIPLMANEKFIEMLEKDTELKENEWWYH